MNKLNIISSGILKNNPTFVLVLGMCPTLGTTTSAANGMGMGLATMAVLIMSNIVISLVKNIIPDKVRIPAFIVIIASFVTIIEMLMKAYVPALYASLGVFIPLIVVNCIILGRAEAFAYKNPPLPSVVDGLTQGIGFTCALTILSAAREFIGAGTFGGGLIDVSNGFRIVLGGADGIQVLPEGVGASLITQPAGGFLSLGIFIAVVTFLLRKSEEKAAKKEATK